MYTYANNSTSLQAQLDPSVKFREKEAMERKYGTQIQLMIFLL